MFETPNFRIDQEGLKLLRNKFCYRTIPFSEFSKIEIFWGHKVRNSRVLALLGFSLLFSAFFLMVNFWYQFSENGKSFYLLEHHEVRAIGANLIIIISLFFSGSGIIVISLQKTVVMKINHTILVPLHTLAANKELEAFIYFLKGKIPDSRLDIPSGISF